jgi:hypothetical protein
MAGKEETPKCRKKTVTWSNEMIEDLIDFIEIHPIVAFEAIYEPMLTSFWSLISCVVQLYIIMQYKGQHPLLLPKMPFCLLYLPPKLVCIPGADPGFQVRGGALTKIAPNGGRRQHFWGISCEKSRFYAKKSYYFQLRREARKFLGYFV